MPPASRTTSTVSSCDRDTKPSAASRAADSGQALVLAAAPDVDRERFFRQPMVYGGIVVAVVPAAAWPVMVVPGWGQPYR
jgi:hypothetical protein